MTVIANRSICAPTPNLSIYKVLAPFCKIFLLPPFKTTCFVSKVHSNVKNMTSRENRNNL